MASTKAPTAWPARTIRRTTIELAFAPALVSIIFTQAFAAWGRPALRAENPRSCILIRGTSPSVVKVDDSGITTEPILLTIEVQGRPEDLKDAQVIYAEDRVQKTAIPVGDLHVGTQKVTVPPGLHMTSSSELFDMTLIGPNGSETPDMTLPLNSENYVPPVASGSANQPSAARPSKEEDEDTDQPINTIQPGVDREEAYSIKQFDAAQVGITSMDGFAKETSGDDAKLPPQTFTLRGVNFKDGMLVRFSTMKGGRPVEVTSPLTQTRILATLKKPSGFVPSNPSALMSAVVVVPAAITHRVQEEFFIRAAHAGSTDACK